MTKYQGTSFTPQRTVNGYALFRAGVKASPGTCDDLAAPLRRHQRPGARRLLSPELRCRPDQCTRMVKAVLAPHYMERAPFTALNAA